MCEVHNALCQIFFFNDTATTEIYTLSLHDALPISRARSGAHADRTRSRRPPSRARPRGRRSRASAARSARCSRRSEEHTSELQSRQYLVCRLLLEKKILHFSLAPFSTDVFTLHV